METANFRKWGVQDPLIIFRLYPVLVKGMTEEEVKRRLLNCKQLGDDDAY